MLKQIKIFVESANDFEENDRLLTSNRIIEVEYESLHLNMQFHAILDILPRICDKVK